jgi:hypothetical protein
VGLEKIKRDSILTENNIGDIKMSLNWDISNVQDWEKKQQEHNELLNVLVWMSMSIGMNRITEKNVDEWVYRLNRIIVENGRTKNFFTPKIVSTFVGLTTNVGTLTATEFEKVIKQRYPNRFKKTRKELDS